MILFRIALSLSDHEEGSSKKSCEKRECFSTFSPILLVLMAPRARSVLQDIEVGSFLVAEVPLVAVAGPTVASGLPHVRPEGRSPQDRFVPGWGVVPNPCNTEHTKSVNSRRAELVGWEAALLSTRVASFSLQKSRLLQ